MVADAAPSESPRGANGTAARRLVDESTRVLRRAAPAAALIAAVALVRACAAGPPPAKTRDALVAALGEAAHVVIRPDDFVWERSGGVLSDFIEGRHILFLGAPQAGAPRDVYRARVHLSPEGRPLQITNVVDYTKTRDTDEQGLVRDDDGERVAFASYGYGQLQGITALDLRSAARAWKTTTRFEGFMAFVTNYQETGDGNGIARVDVLLERATTSAVLSFEGPILVAKLAEAAGGVREARVDIDQAKVTPPVDGVTADLLVQIPKRPIHWAVDSVRAIVGDDAVAWAEAKVWELRDKYEQWRYFAGRSGTDAHDEVKSDADLLVPHSIDPTQAGVDGGYWPPQEVPTLFKEPEEGEGEWQPYQPSWLHRIDGAPPAFYKTFIRPDAQRPYSKIILVAMDTRQLDLGMEAGVEDPKPTVGSFHGAGRMPRDPWIASHAVAAWNGGFKTEHGHYGMMLRKHILLPPVPTAATAVVEDDGRFGMGAWGPTREIPADLLSYRQNMDPLIDDGIINPRARGNWGAVLPGQPKLTGQQTERSGLCITRARHLLYVWGDDVGPEALGKAMQLAGCDFGMHLDMNPYHTGFVFMSFDDKDYSPKRGNSEVLTSSMAIANRRYIDYNPKDFFYATIRDPSPDLAGDAPLGWIADAGVQPPPTWLPAIWHTVVGGTPGKPGGVSLALFEPGRTRWTLRAGQDEVAPSAEGKPGKLASDVPREMNGDDATRVIAAIGFGVADPRRPLGLLVQGVRAIAPVEEEASLYVRPDGALDIALPADPVPTAALDLAQGAALIADGKAIDGARRRSGSFRRLAIGVTALGRIVVATADGNTDDGLVDALLRAGCVRAMAARGAEDGFVARAGTPEPPMSSYAQTTLYAIAQPMGPRAFRFDRDLAGKPLYPPVDKPVP